MGEIDLRAVRRESPNDEAAVQAEEWIGSAPGADP
jgi:hypothetical protein